VESIFSFRLVLGADFLFGALVFAFAFLIPVFSNQRELKGDHLGRQQKETAARSPRYNSSQFE
jgi:hypothetical protein